MMGIMSRQWFALVLSLVSYVSSTMYVSGPLDGLTCDSEAVQSTIAGQFNTILSELTDTTFFRLVRVEGEGYCPIDSLRTDTTGGAPTCGQVDDAFASYSPPSAAYDPFGGSSSTFGGDSEDSSSHEGGELCSIEPEKSFQQSEEKLITSISPEEMIAQHEFPRDNDCVEEGEGTTFRIRPDYWLDICNTTADIASQNDNYEYVNIKINPERNTGYDGQVIWEDMHNTTGDVASTEGVILQRLVSGYHTATTTHIMNSYFPPSRKNKLSPTSTVWQPNVKKFAAYASEERVKNMQFAFVLVARSLFKIKDYLYEYQYTTGNFTADQTTRQLMDHLLDTSVLSTCDSVLTGFDESVMFDGGNVKLTAPKFKKAFRRVQNAVNCVTCHRCKLHAQVAIHGLGVAIKILLTGQPELLFSTLSRDDIVALVNTLHKISEAITISNELMSQYYAELAAATTRSDSSGSYKTGDGDDSDAKNVLIDEALSFIANNRHNMTKMQEDALVNAFLLLQTEDDVGSDSTLLLLAKHFRGWGFVRHALIHLEMEVPDVVVVGGGLAGLVTAVSVADRGGSVVIVEKQASLGGNSAKASSGINSIPLSSSSDDSEGRDSDLDLFYADTIKSQNGHGSAELAHILVHSANESVSWLSGVTGIDLDPSKSALVGQLGGHARPRTHRPVDGVVGAEIMAALIKQVADRHPLIQVRYRSTVEELLRENEGGGGAVVGVRYNTVSKDGVSSDHVQHARSTVLASGGFGFDAAGLLQSYRPDLVSFPTTLGSHTMGDGIQLATAVGADVVDMDFVQLHPTGFVDPHDPQAHTKVLGAEILRGIGGILLQKGSGKRFVNELDTRKKVCDEMQRHMASPSSTSSFWIVIGEKSYHLEERLLNIYFKRNLLRNVTGSELVAAVGPGVIDTLLIYDNTSLPDPFGRQLKRGVPLQDSAFFLLGEVTPVIHYTMGGVRIDSSGRVLTSSSSVVEGLYAVGEVSGGVHGQNRLGGNSLLECTVFGRRIGSTSVPVNEELVMSHFPRGRKDNTRKERKVSGKGKEPSTEVTMSELQQHSSVGDCWTLIEDYVFDLSDYADEHPGGEDAIKDSCGVDSTSRFKTAHSMNLLRDLEFDPIGKIKKL